MTTPGIAALVLMAVVGLSYHEWRLYNRANAKAAQMRAIVDSVDHLLSNLVDAETGQRGYLLTGKNRYLQPYNQAVQTIPTELARLQGMRGGRSSESSNIAHLTDLTNRKLAELQQTIELRRTQGGGPALALMLSGEDKRTMDEIRVLCAQIRRTEISSQSQASTEGEAAAGTALLATIAGSLVLLFLFAFGLEPFASPDPQAQRRSWPLRYGVAVLTVVVIVLFRMALTPLMGGRSMPFTLFFPAVWFAAWFGGLRPGALSVALSALAGAYFFAEPTGSLLIRYHDDQTALLMLVIVGFGMGLLSRSQQHAVERAMQAENGERIERQRFETTLASIGDAVIATDAEGRVTFANKVALSLTRWTESEIAGKPLDEAFQIVNEFTRAAVESPVARVLRLGAIAGLANHTVLLARDGTEVPIDDSAAPIRGPRGEMMGAVLVFRDVSERRATERRLADQAAELRQRAQLMEPAPLSVRDLEDRILYWNRGAAELYGFSAAEALGQVSHALLKTMFPAPLSEIQTQLLTRGHWSGELVQTRRTGESVTVLSEWTLHRGEDGRPPAVLEVHTDITARKHAERALEESEERYRITLTSIADGVLTTDVACHVSYLNPVAEQLTGWSTEEASGQPLADLFRIIDEESRQAVENPVARVLQEGRVAGLANHTMLITRDGREVFIDDSAAPIRDRSGAVQGAVLVFRDNSERRRVERELRESEKRYHLAVEAAPNGMLVSNARGEIVLVNSYTEKLFGYSREELIGQPVEMLVPERFRDSHPGDRQRFLGEPQARSMGAGRDLYGRRKDGSEFPVEIGLNPIQAGRDMLVLASVVDISERLESEATRRLLASVVESSVDGIISKDLRGVITSWNRGAERMFGYSAEEMIGRTIAVIVPSGDVNEIPSVLERIARGEPVEQYETVRQTKDGRRITVSATWSPVPDARGRIAGASMVVRDITERKQMEEQRLELLAKERALASERALREMEAELARVVRALSLGELATSIAHEVNQPLAGVVTNAEAGLRWLSGNAPNIEEARDSLANIAEDGARAGEVIRRLREFLKKRSPETAPLDINDVVQEAVALTRAELVKRQVEVQIELSGGLPCVRGDRIQLQQVIVNLIMNGADAVAGTAASKKILVSSRSSADQHVIVAVRDSGAGISAQDMPRMFEAFFTTKPTGMGMGLSISRSILEAHGGRIWAEANEGPGITVQFALPTTNAVKRLSAAAGDES
ncbi:MAG TPA: PAS domain S-box protein [Bryobacteraceae bacterium]|nr:PAS domain S-box protein [Bryobacteraceae bacterium]